MAVRTTAAPSARVGWLAGAGAGSLLLLTYLATLAPGVTLWDAGELIAAAHGLGVPHPPGTPLFVVIGRAWIALLRGVPPALALNILSALCTAGACAVLAHLVARWCRSAALGLGAGIAAGLPATIWASATETEAYAPALLLAALALLAADAAGRRGGVRRALLVTYLLALAVPLHLFALVVAPAAIALAASGERGVLRARVALAHLAAVVAIVAVGTVRPPLLLAAALLGLAAVPWRAGAPALGRAAAAAAGAATVVLLGASVLVVMLVRAAHDPPLNQGDPSTWAALVDVLARRQYAAAGLWPRQAPLWLQVGNLIEYVDWQFALALAPTPPPAWSRTPVTLLFVALAAWGSVVHRRLDRRGWRAMALLLGAGTVGVVLYLNLKAGPSFGAGVLPEGAPREARERDYFFAFGFWALGAWAGVGAVAAGRWATGRAWPGVALALLPLALNWRAVDRARGPDATIAADVARALLLPMPADAVYLAAGDNDTYPLWYAQQVEGVRPDVTVIVTPLLPAGWYRAELARRHGLGAAASPATWHGTPATVSAVVADAARGERPILGGVQLSASLRAATAGRWELAGPWYRWRPDDGSPGTDDDGAAARAAAALAARQVGDGASLPPSDDPATRAMRRALSCAPLALRADHESAALLASRCNRP